LPSDFLFDIQVAVGEACTNIIQHAYNSRPDRPITVGCRLRNQEFIVRIRDFGQPFSPDTIVMPQVDVKLQERRPNGLGMYLMQKLVTRVKYQSGGHRGNEVTLVKKLPEPAVPMQEAAADIAS
jgi:serine/threonine-protein kinase RsbW